MIVDDWESEGMELSEAATIAIRAWHAGRVERENVYPYTTVHQDDMRAFKILTIHFSPTEFVSIDIPWDVIASKRDGAAVADWIAGQMKLMISRRLYAPALDVPAAGALAESPGEDSPHEAGGVGEGTSEAGGD